MNIKNRKKLIIILVVLLFIVFLFMCLFGRNKDRENNKSNVDEISIKDYDFRFGDALDLEEARGFEEYATNGTQYPSLGILSDFYDGAHVEYYEDKIIMQTSEGYITISASWMDEGLAQKIKEPEFGVLEKFILKTYSVSARYTDVSMKDAIEYMNILSGLGYTTIRLDKKDKKNDYYYYSVENSEGTVVKLDYESGILVITVYA